MSCDCKGIQTVEAYGKNNVIATSVQEGMKDILKRHLCLYLDCWAGETGTPVN